MNSDFMVSGIKIECRDKYLIGNDGAVNFCVKVSFDKDALIKVVVKGCGSVCHNCEGKNCLGEKFEKVVKVSKNVSKNFWITAVSAGNCVLEVKNENGETLAEKSIRIIRTDKISENPSVSKTLGRLAWLNSDKAINHEVVKPFDRIVLLGDEIGIAGRKISLKNGLPSGIKSYFNKSVKITDKFVNIISRPVEFNVSGENFKLERTEKKDFDDMFIEEVVLKSENFRLFRVTKVEFDGFVEIKNTLQCLVDVEIDDISLDIPFCAETLKYFMGLGKKSGLFDRKLGWKWDENKNQDCFWAGNTNAGLKVKLKGANYRKPFVNIYYNQRKLNKPESWDNDGKGGVRYENNSFIAYSGSRTVKKGEKLVFDVELIVTPLKEIDLKKQIEMRIFHRMFDCGDWLAEAKKAGANVINIHHGNDLNPYINYPFAEMKALKSFAEEAHRNGVSVKPYYTIRELSVYSPEFNAFRDLDCEIIAKNDDCGEINPWQKDAADWIRKNIGEDVICAWRQPLKGTKYKNKYDASVITEGQSRLCNFYVEGLDYLVKKADIDGIYIDDVAYDRNVMKRVRKVLDQKPNALIDFHQWNHHLAAEGNCATMYMELYPYVDKCWIGEGFDYDESPDYWLTEISGIPYGVMSEMMDSGNQYKGLTFGMTSRAGWETNDGSPSNIWGLFDRFDLKNAEIKGWWDDENLASTDSEEILATMYIGYEKAYIALANFSSDRRTAKITVNGKGGVSFYAPFIENFQSERTMGDEVEIDGGKGLFLLILEQEN